RDREESLRRLGAEQAAAPGDPSHDSGGDGATADHRRGRPEADAGGARGAGAESRSAREVARTQRSFVRPRARSHAVARHPALPVATGRSLAGRRAERASRYSARTADRPPGGDNTEE